MRWHSRPPTHQHQWTKRLALLVQTCSVCGASIWLESAWVAGRHWKCQECHLA